MSHSMFIAQPLKSTGSHSGIPNNKQSDADGADLGCVPEVGAEHEFHSRPGVSLCNLTPRPRQRTETFNLYGIWIVNDDNG